jgi:hypothetical protein
MGIGIYTGEMQDAIYSENDNSAPVRGLCHSAMVEEIGDGGAI